MKIALAQTNIIFQDREKNLERAASLISQAAQQGCRLILFPEMSFTGFTMAGDAYAENAAARMGARETVSAYAKRFGIAVGFGYIRRGKNQGDRPRNCYQVVDAQGRTLASYDKIHPFSYAGEDANYAAGDRPISFTLGEYTFGMSICYDLRFPGLYQQYVPACQVLLVPANWPKKRRLHYVTLLMARAVETQTFVLGINCVGRMDGQEYAGDTMAVSPEGRILARAGEDETLLTVALNPEELAIRQSFPVLADRKEPYDIC